MEAKEIELRKTIRDIIITHTNTMANADNDKFISINSLGLAVDKIIKAMRQESFTNWKYIDVGVCKSCGLRLRAREGHIEPLCECQHEI